MIILGVGSKEFEEKISSLNINSMNRSIHRGSMFSKNMGSKGKYYKLYNMITGETRSHLRIKDVAKEFGLHIDTVRARIKKRIPLDQWILYYQDEVIDPVELEERVRIYKRDIAVRKCVEKRFRSTTQVAKELGLTYEEVRSSCRRSKIVFVTDFIRNKRSVVLIQKDNKPCEIEFNSIEIAAKHFGIHPCVIHRSINKNEPSPKFGLWFKYI